MKIAVCIYGQPRFYKHGYMYLHELINKYPTYTFDFFIHCWFSESDVGTQYTHSYYRNVDENELIVKPDVDKEIVELYHPKMVEFEPVRTFDVSFIYGSLIDKNTTERQRSNYNNVLSSSYSKLRVNQILQTYMNTNNETYDLVIATRFDYLNDFIVDLPSIDKSKLNIIHCPTHFNINDSYIITNPQIYNDYSQTYNNLEHLINDENLKQMYLKYSIYYEFVPENIILLNLLYLHGEKIMACVEMRHDMLQFFKV